MMHLLGREADVSDYRLNICVRAKVEETSMPRYRPKNIAALRRCLRNCPAEMSVEIERGVSVTAKIVAELRSLPGWPYGLVLIVHIDPDPRFSMVKVERV